MSSPQFLRRAAVLLTIGVIYMMVAAVPTRADFVLTQTPLWLNPKDRSDIRVGQLEFRGGLHITSEDERFGGLSGLAVTRDGSRFLAVSDKGYWVKGRLAYKDGRLDRIYDEHISALLGTSGKPLARRRKDAEALAVENSDTDGFGKVFVGFELHPRIWSYNLREKGLASPAVPLPRPGLLTLFGGNRGLESLSQFNESTLIGLSEGASDGNGRFLGLLFDAKALGPGTTEPVWLEPFGKFAPTDLARLPDGDLLLLERRYTILGGPAMRLRRISKESVTPGAVLDGQPLAQLTSKYSIDNMEGLAVRPGEDGRPLIYLISDDNYFRFQRTVLLLFSLNGDNNVEAKK